MLAKPGDKVLIIEDCREGSPATGQVGVYEGDFPRGVLVMFADRSREFDYTSFVEGAVRYSGDHPLVDRPLVSHIPFWTVEGRYEHPLGDEYPVMPDKTKPFWFPTDNPRIKLPDGSVIWGDECWWRDAENAPPLEEAQADLKDHKTVLRGMYNTLSSSSVSPMEEAREDFELRDDGGARDGTKKETQ